MSQDKLQFLKTIAQSPKENTPRLVYADWLQETGVPTDYQRGELIRVQCEIGTTPPHRDIEAPTLKSYLPITWASQSSTETHQGTVLKSELKDLGSLTTRSLVNIPQLKSPKGQLFIIASTSEIYDLGNPMTFSDRRRDGRIDIRVQQVDPKETNPEYTRLVERQDELIQELYGAAYLQRLRWERISKVTGINSPNDYRGTYSYNAFSLDRGLASEVYVTADQMKTLLPRFCLNHPVTTVYLLTYDGPESCVTGSWPEQLPFLEAVLLPSSIVEPYTRMYRDAPGICGTLHETLNRLKDRSVKVDVWGDSTFNNPYRANNQNRFPAESVREAMERTAARAIAEQIERDILGDDYEDPFDHTSPDPTDWEGELRPEPVPSGETPGIGGETPGIDFDDLR